MRRLALLGLAGLIGCAAGAYAPAPPNAAAIALRNAGFEEAPQAAERCPVQWGCTMHANPNSFRFVLDESAPAEGKRSLCIERVTPEPWAVASQAVPAQALRGRKLRFSLAMRAEALGGPGAGLWFIVNGPQGMLLDGKGIAMLGNRWEARTIEFQVPPQAIEIEVGATLEGSGRVCIDDARLEPA